MSPIDIKEVARFTDGNGNEITFKTFREEIGKCEDNGKGVIVEKSNKDERCSIFYSWLGVRAHSKKEGKHSVAMTYSLYDTQRKVVQKIGWCGSYLRRIYMYMITETTVVDRSIAKRLFRGDLA